MGSLSKDTGKDRSLKEEKAQHKTDRSWQLLFVDGRGKIVSHVWFKSTAIIILSALLLSIFCSIIFCFYFIKYRNENTGLKEEIEASESRMKALQNERDILLARLVLAESKIKAVSEQKPVLEQVPVEPEKSIKPDDSAEKKSSGRETVSKKPDPVEKNIPKIEVTDFNLSYEPDPNNDLKIQFVIRNSGQRVKTVQGYLFVVLKPDGNDHHKWLTIPSAEFLGGKPKETTKGRFFRISRFKTIRFKMSGKVLTEQYKTGTVFIFNKEGIKQFEKSFPVLIETVHPKGDRKKMSTNGAQVILKEADSVKLVEKKSETIPVKVYEDAGKTKNKVKSSPEIQPGNLPQSAVKKNGPAEEELKQ